MNAKAQEFLEKKGVLISPDVEEEDLNIETLQEIIDLFNDNLDVLDDEAIELYEKRKYAEENKPLVVTRSFEEKGKERTFQDFVETFNNRFDHTAKMLKQRQELSGLTGISRAVNKERGTEISILGMVMDKRLTRNNNLIFELEDRTDTITVVIKNDEERQELFETAKDIQLDEVIGVVGAWLGGALFANTIIFPDIPMGKPLKKQQKEEWVAFLGDPHFGSNVFLEKEFKRFLAWIQGKVGNEEQRRIAKNIKYIVCPGDVIEGAGIYPGQEEELALLDVKDQYKLAAKYLKQIPDDIEIIAIPGNHDTGRLAEPQQTISKRFAPDLWTIPNLQLASNPCVVNIGKTEDFPGFNIVIYHGGSLIYYSQNIPTIRNAGGQKRPDLLMKYMLQRRHLAPTHGSTPYLPGGEDHLLIETIPDFLVTGHIHRASIANYRNVTMVNASAWTETTEDQIKRGLEPQPGRLPLVNLQTREMKMMNFLTKETKKAEQEKAQRATNI